MNSVASVPVQLPMIRLTKRWLRSPEELHRMGHRTVLSLDAVEQAFQEAVQELSI